MAAVIKVARMRRLGLVLRMDEAATPNDSLFAASWGSQMSWATTAMVAGLCDRRHDKCWGLGTGKKETRDREKWRESTEEAKPHQGLLN